MKIDCSKTVNYFKEKVRMTNMCGILCRDCPISSDNNKMSIDCNKFQRKYPEQAVEIVQKWSDEHPQKTRLELFYENYPNAPHHDGVPNACVGAFGYEGYAERHTDECEFCQECYMCRKCWNMPV